MIPEKNWLEKFLEISVITNGTNNNNKKKRENNFSRGSKRKKKKEKLSKLVREKRKKNWSTSRFETTSKKMTQRREVEREGFQARQRDKDIISSALRNLTPRAVDSQQTEDKEEEAGSLCIWSADYLEEINQPGTA